MEAVKEIPDNFVNFCEIDDSYNKEMKERFIGPIKSKDLNATHAHLQQFATNYNINQNRSFAKFLTRVS